LKKQTRRTRLGTPAPVPGRKHMTVQTSRYLEEIHVTPQECDVSLQTDPMLDYPSEPLFIPQPSGPSVATQIEAGDLFNFDLEVEPILETLIGKCLDIALMQVCEEEELKALRHHRQMYELKRNAELNECQRLQERERRLFEEKERRKRQAQQYALDLKKKQKADAAKLITKEKLQFLKQNVFEGLMKKGVFEDPLQNFISTNILQKIYEGVSSLLQPSKAAFEIAQLILKQAVQSISIKKEQANKSIEQEIQRRGQLQSEKEELTKSITETEEQLQEHLSNWKDITEPTFPEDIEEEAKTEAEEKFQQEKAANDTMLTELVEKFKEEKLLSVLTEKWTLNLEQTEIEFLREKCEFLQNKKSECDVRQLARETVKLYQELPEESQKKAIEELKFENVEEFLPKNLKWEEPVEAMIKLFSHRIELLKSLVPQETKQVEED